MPRPAPLGAAFERLDRHVVARMAAARTPGMTLALFDREGCRRVATYGLADPEAGSPLVIPKQRNA